LFSGHNFWTWNLRKSSKETKESDFSLISKENLNEILQPSSLGPEPDEVGKKAQNYSTYDKLPKNSKPKTKKFFFIANSKAWRVFWAFEQLSCAISLELRPRKDTRKLLDLGWNHTGFKGVKLLQINIYVHKICEK